MATIPDLTDAETWTDDDLDQLRVAEEWRPVPGWEATHEVSDRGRVRSRTRVLTQRDDRGYAQVTLRHRDRLKSYLVHRLVALAFLGPRPDGMEVCHGDGNKRNNTPANLRYGTPRDNGADKRKHGHGWRGEAVNTARMTVEKVREARRRHEAGESVTTIAKAYGMSRPGMSHIINRRHWAWA